MNFYETTYIIHPALQAGRLDDLVSTIDTKIKSLNGNKLYFENWGKKKLAYAIDKQKYGIYIITQFSMGSENVKNLVNEFEHNSNILRYLINKINKLDILEEEKKEVQNIENKEQKIVPNEKKNTELDKEEK